MFEGELSLRDAENEIENEIRNEFCYSTENPPESCLN